MVMTILMMIVPVISDVRWEGVHLAPVLKSSFKDHHLLSQTSSQAPSYASSKLSLARLRTGVRCRATSVAKNLWLELRRRGCGCSLSEDGRRENNTGFFSLSHCRYKTSFPIRNITKSAFLLKICMRYSAKNVLKNLSSSQIWFYKLMLDYCSSHSFVPTARKLVYHWTGENINVWNFVVDWASMKESFCLATLSPLENWSCNWVDGCCHKHLTDGMIGMKIQIEPTMEHCSMSSAHQICAAKTFLLKTPTRPLLFTGIQNDQGKGFGMKWVWQKQRIASCCECNWLAVALQ